MFQVNTMVLIIRMVLVTYQGHAQLSISTSTPTPCYGDVVTLVCHHPELATNRSKYFTTTPTWRENGAVIDILDGTIYTADPIDLTHTTLTINITVDHFRNKSFKYFCVLILAGEDGDASGSEKSEEVTVDPVDLSPLHITNMDPLESSITVRWTPQPCAVRYRVSWMYTNDDGTTTTGSGVSDQVTNYTIPTSVQGVYTVSVQAVDGVGNVGPATSEVVRSTYPRPTADAPPCEDRSLVLTCLVSGLHNDRRSHFIWMDANGPLDNSDQHSITGDQLMIANISGISDEDKAIRCSEVLTNGIVVTGEEYMVEPLAQPGPPEVIITTTDSTITLTWNTALHCFESEMFTFVVIWNEIGSGASSNVTTSSSPYTISGLQPGTSYQISVQGVGGSGVVGGIRVLNVTTTLAESPSDDRDPTAAIAGIVIGVVIGMVTIILVVGTCTVISRKINRWKAKPRLYDIGQELSERDPQPDSPTSVEPTRTGYYAQVGFEDDQPLPAPPVELVTYANPIAVGEEEVKDTVLVLPPKQQDHHKIEEFRSDVAHALIAIGVDNVTAIEMGGVPHFTAEYNGIHFVVTCVCPSSDVTLEDINLIIEAKQVTGSTKGLLISNQPTMPSECLLTLEDAGCQFVPVSGYGEEGWEDRMVDKFKGVFLKSDDLPTSEQETSLLSDTQSPVVQPRTGLARLLSPVGFAIQKRRNAPGGYWVESEEETTPPQDFPSVSLHRDSESGRPPSPVQISNLSSSDRFPKHVISRAADDDDVKSGPSQTHNDPFRSPQGDTIVGAQDSGFMPSVIDLFLVPPVEYKQSNEEEEVLHKGFPQEEVEEEEAMPTPVQETPLTACPPPSTAASIGNLEYLEEPLPTVASVASSEFPEMLLMVLTVFSYEYSDLPRADDSNISPEQTFETTHPQLRAVFGAVLNGWTVSSLLVLFVCFGAIHSGPTISTSTPTPCYGDVVTLVCHHPELAGKKYSRVQWRENSGRINLTAGTPFTTNKTWGGTHTNLIINITVNHFKFGNKSFNYSCQWKLMQNGQPSRVETSEAVTVDPIDHSDLSISTSTPTPCYGDVVKLVCHHPEVVSNPGGYFDSRPTWREKGAAVVVVVADVKGPPEVTNSTITLAWNTALRCFESEMFTFVVIWNEIGSGTRSNVTTSSSPYTISGLHPGTSYQISVLVMGESGVISRMTLHNVATLGETPTEGGDPTAAVIIAVVSVIILVAVVIVIILVVACCWKTGDQGEYDTGSSVHENGGGVSLQKLLPRRKGSKDSAQDIGENILTSLKKFISKTREKVGKASRSKWIFRGAGLLLMGTLIYYGPGSPECHLATSTPDSHRGMKTDQPMWELVITYYDRGRNEMEEVIVFSEQDIQEEANLDHLLNPLLSMILEEGTIPRCLSAPCLQSTDSEDTTRDTLASLPNLSVQ